MNNISDQNNRLATLKQIEKQIRSVQKMITDQESALDILTLTQIVKKSLDDVGDAILRDHLQDCIVSLTEKTSKENIEQDLDEILKIIIEARKRM